MERTMDRLQMGDLRFYLELFRLNLVDHVDAGLVGRHFERQQLFDLG